MQQFFSCSRVKHSRHQKPKNFVAQPSRLWGQRASCPLIGRPAEGSLRPRSEHGLKIGALFFPRDYTDINVLEAGVFQKLVQLHFTETEPVIGVKLARPLERMAQQIEDHDASVLS